MQRATQQCPFNQFESQDVVPQHNCYKLKKSIAQEKEKKIVKDDYILASTENDMNNMSMIQWSQVEKKKKTQRDIQMINESNRNIDESDFSNTSVLINKSTSVQQANKKNYDYSEQLVKPLIAKTQRNRSKKSSSRSSRTQSSKGAQNRKRSKASKASQYCKIVNNAIGEDDEEGSVDTDEEDRKYKINYTKDNQPTEKNKTFGFLNADMIFSTELHSFISDSDKAPIVAEIEILSIINGHSLVFRFINEKNNTGTSVLYYESNKKTELNNQKYITCYMYKNLPPDLQMIEMNTSASYYFLIDIIKK